MIPGAWQTFLATATAWRSYVLVWFEAKDRDNPAVLHPLGLWSGDDHQEISVGGVTRLYYGAQGNLALPNGITYRAGLEVQMLDVLIGPLAPEVEQLLRGYEPKQARAEVHVKLDDVDGVQVGPVWRAWHGRVDTVSLSTEGGWGDVETGARVTMVPSSRDGTNAIPDTKSDATYKRNAADGIGRYMAVGGTVRTPWGTKVDRDR
jgi:hypothetical protein